MASTHGLLLARGPWSPDAGDGGVARGRRSSPTAADTAAADAALAALRERGSPSHDGLAARLAGFEQRDDGLQLELQPARWSLRLVGSGRDAQRLGAVRRARRATGRWLAGRRAAWLASWTGRWTLGAGGAVEVGEQPVDALVRELEEEWSVAPERLTVEALAGDAERARVPRRARVARRRRRGACRDDEHDAHAWWPADVARWPDEADEPLRRMAALLA